MKAKYSPAEIAMLASAMGQLLDEMGEDGLEVSLSSKAEARAAYEPFGGADEKVDMMTLEAAREILQGTS